MSVREISAGLEAIGKHLQEIGVDLQRVARLMPQETSAPVEEKVAQKDRALTPKEVADALGYKVETLHAMRSNNDPLIAGLPMFKLCECEATRRKTQARCRHPYYAMESDVLEFFRQRKERYLKSAG